MLSPEKGPRQEALFPCGVVSQVLLNTCLAKPTLLRFMGHKVCTSRLVVRLVPCIRRWYGNERLG